MLFSVHNWKIYGPLKLRFLNLKFGFFFNFCRGVCFLDEPCFFWRDDRSGKVGLTNPF